MQTITAADIARKVNVKPETARAKLRRAYATGNKGLPKPLHDGTWLFRQKDAPKVRSLITRRPN